MTLDILLPQLPRKWSDSVAWQRCAPPGPYSVPVASAGSRDDCHGQLQSRWPQGAWLLVRCWNSEKERDAHFARDLCQDHPRVSILTNNLCFQAWIFIIIFYMSFNEPHWWVWFACRDVGDSLNDCQIIFLTEIYKIEEAGSLGDVPAGSESPLKSM